MSREKTYSQGGILSVTSRILVVDLLSSKQVELWIGIPSSNLISELLDPEKITGIILLHAERRAD
jgi:DNA excision repair protein ERCC-4